MSGDPLGALLAVLVDGGPPPTTSPPPELVRVHRLAPLAHTHGVPGFRADHLAAGLRVEQHREIAAEAAAVLAGANIPVILLKGASYAGWLYADPAERPMTDVDLMVSPAQHELAARVLAGLGYAPGGPAHQRSPRQHALTLRRPHAAVDLHRGPVQLGRIAIDDRLWERARASTWIPGALHLDPVDETLFHFAFMARQDLIGPAILHVDAGRLLRSLDGAAWQRLLERASHWRFRRVLETLVGWTEHLIGWRDRPPTWWLPKKDEALGDAPPSRLRQLARKPLLLGGPREVAHFAVATIDGWRRQP
jgi:hypothetical protein